MSAQQAPSPKVFAPTVAVGPRFTAANGDFTVSSNWKRGEGVNVLINCNATEFTLNEAIEIRKALSALIKQVEKATR